MVLRIVVVIIILTIILGAGTVLLIGQELLQEIRDTISSYL